MITSALIYIILGVFENLAVFGLMLKLYRLPFWTYKIELVLMAAWLSIVSYVIRVVFEVPNLDLPIQLVFFVLFVRYVLKIKLFYSVLITAAGILAYIIIQLLGLYVLTFAGVDAESVIFKTGGADVNLIQSVSITVSTVVALLLKKFNLGFAFIYMPPHDFAIKENYLSPVNRSLLMGTFAALIVLASAVYILFSINPIVLIIVATLSFLLLYFFSHRRELSDD